MDQDPDDIFEPNPRAVAGNNSDHADLDAIFAIINGYLDGRKRDVRSAEDVGSLPVKDRDRTIAAAHMLAIARIFRTGIATPVDLGILHFVALHSNNENGRCVQSFTQIAAVLNVDSRTVRRRFSELVKLGVICTELRPGETVACWLRVEQDINGYSAFEIARAIYNHTGMVVKVDARSRDGKPYPKHWPTIDPGHSVSGVGGYPGQPVSGVGVGHSVSGVGGYPGQPVSGVGGADETAKNAVHIKNAGDRKKPLPNYLSTSTNSTTPVVDSAKKLQKNADATTGSPAQAPRVGSGNLFDEDELGDGLCVLKGSAVSWVCPKTRTKQKLTLHFAATLLPDISRDLLIDWTMDQINTAVAQAKEGNLVGWIKACARSFDKWRADYDARSAQGSYGSYDAVDPPPAWGLMECKPITELSDDHFIGLDIIGSTKKTPKGWRPPQSLLDAFPGHDWRPNLAD